jgi:hypothetical protein
MWKLCIAGFYQTLSKMNYAAFLSPSCDRTMANRVRLSGGGMAGIATRMHRQPAASEIRILVNPCHARPFQILGVVVFGTANEVATLIARKECRLDARRICTTNGY